MHHKIYTELASRRNAHQGRDDLHHDDRLLHDLTLGGREVYRRTRWSPPLCNRLAELAGIGASGMEG